MSTQNNLSDLDAMLGDLGSGYTGDYSDYLDASASQRSGNPTRPPAPRDYSPPAMERPTSANSSTLPRARHPPKLQHTLDRRKKHHLEKAGPRDDDVMQAPADFSDDYDYSSGQHPPPSVIPDLSDDEMEEV